MNEAEYWHDITENGFTFDYTLYGPYAKVRRRIEENIRRNNE